MSPQTAMPPVGVRWTIGDVSDAGYETLRVSIHACWRLFGSSARFAVCVNSIPLGEAVRKTGELPCDVIWLDANDRVPAWLNAHTGPEMAEGVAWKFAPVRVFPDRHELSLDNDIVLWQIPPAMRAWLDAKHSCLMSADVQPALGQFAEMCGHRALNSGIRGFYPGFDVERALADLLQQSGVTLHSELDEQGLQAAVLLRSRLHVVTTEDVSICSPFPMHQRRLGNCGVHFVGLNPKTMPWILEGRPGHEVILERWRSFLPAVEALISGYTMASTGAIPTLQPLPPDTLSRAADAP